MNLEEIKEKQGLLKAAILESKARAEELEGRIDPLKQKLFKEQELRANLRLEYNLLEQKRFLLEKPSAEVEKLAAALMKQHNLSREFALEVVTSLRGGN